MAINEDNPTKRFFKRFSKSPIGTLNYYFNIRRIKWYTKRFLGRIKYHDKPEEFKLFEKLRVENLKKVQIGDITKNCLITNANSSFTTKPIKINKNNKLYLSIRIKKQLKKGVILRIRVNKDIIISKNIFPELYKNKDWIDFKIDLDKYKNKSIKINFSTKSKNKLPKRTEKDSIIWSEPILLKKSDNPNILLISIDGCRADHLSLYGYARNTTPNINKLAKEGIIFNNAFSNNLWTFLSHNTLFTGLYPSTYEELSKNNEIKINNIPKVLRKFDYINYAYTSHFRLRSEAFGNGFDYFVHNQCNKESNKGVATDITNKTISFLDEIRDDNPMFVFLHFFDTHEPYDPPNPFYTYFNKLYKGETDGYDFSKFIIKENEGKKSGLTEEIIDNMIDLYDSTIAYVDSEIGNIINKLKNLKLYENTMIIIIGDHGEEFKERLKFKRNKMLNEAITKVPLIIKLPNKKLGKVKKEMAQLVDIFPTIMRTVNNSEKMNQIQGKCLFDKNKTDFVMSEKTITYNNDIYYLSIKYNNFRYLYSTKVDIFKKNNLNKAKKECSEKLFNIKKDPFEENNLINKSKEEMIVMRKRRDNFLNKQIETLEKLKER